MFNFLLWWQMKNKIFVKRINGHEKSGRTIWIGVRAVCVRWKSPRGYTIHSFMYVAMSFEIFRQNSVIRWVGLVVCLARDELLGFCLVLSNEVQVAIIIYRQMINGTGACTEQEGNILQNVCKC